MGRPRVALGGRNCLYRWPFADSSALRAAPARGMGRLPLPPSPGDVDPSGSLGFVGGNGEAVTPGCACGSRCCTGDELAGVPAPPACSFDGSIDSMNAMTDSCVYP